MTMAKHHRVTAENINKSPRLSYLSSHSHSTSFMSEGGGEITELMSLDESEGLLEERYGCTSSIHVISGKGTEDMVPGYDGNNYNSKLLASPAVTIVEMSAETAPRPRKPSAFKGRNRGKSAIAAAAAAAAASGEQTTLNAIGLQLSIDQRGGPSEWGEATRSYVKAQQRRHAGRATFQGQVYNFLERPAGYKCIIYHVSVSPNPQVVLLNKK